MTRGVIASAKLLAALVVVLVVAAFTYEHIGAWLDARVLKQVGRSVDIGGRSLNIYCSGEGSPTVIFESGRTAPGYIWTPSQRGVSAFTRACWYDRATIGWSDPGPAPATGDAAARDLHQLVRNAGLKPPFVLVGASFGGYIIRLYHHAYPGEVAGMVFVDASLEDAGTIRNMPRRAPSRLPRVVIRGLSRLFGELGMIRMMAADPVPPPQNWTPAEWDVLARLRRERKILLADAQVGSERDTAALVRSAGGLEDMPMIVLTQGRPIPNSNSVEGQVRHGWVGLQHRFAERSRRGRQVLVPESGHGIPIEAPGAVIAAVREIVDTLHHGG